MSTDNTETNDVTIEDNLDDFAADFFGGNSEEPSDNAKSEDVKVEQSEDNDAPEELEDTHSADDGATEDDSSEENPDETDEDDETFEEDKPKKVNRFQERINELTAKARQEEREKLELLKRLEALESKLPKEADEPKPAPKQEQESTGAPTPTDKNEDGTDKYPLGEFDPQFLRDTVQHMLDQKEAEQREQTAKTEQEREALQQRNALQESWNEKLVDVQERYPDYQEKGQELLDSLGDIEPAYGQYLTDTLMEMDNGPEVFYYLASHPEETQKIVDAGPRKATIALGRLEAQFGGSKTTQATPKTTNAKTPPPRVKGSAVARPSVALDTDDLDAFSRELFKKKK